jgi:membrane protease YdiL (CAAX protease family)
MEEHSISENLPSADERQQPQKYLPLKKLVREHPYWSAVILVVYAIIILESLRFIVFLIDLSPSKVPSVPGNLVAEIVFTLFWVLLPLYVLDWWHTPGFQTVLTWPLRIRGYRGLFLGLFLVLGLFPLLLLTFSSTIHRTASTTILLITLLSLFVGIAEEGLFRGLILNILLPKGIWRAVLLSSLLFGSVHLLNVFVGFPLTGALIQVISALGFGMFLAALRLRTNSLRPGIIAHAIWDLPLIILNLHRQNVAPPSLPLAFAVGGILFSIYVFSTLIVLRRKKMREIRAVYGFMLDKPNI